MMRPVAQGRKSWLFAGSLRGEERLAELLTLLHTARLNGLEPVVWLRDVLEKLPSWRRPGWMNCCLTAIRRTEYALP